MKKFVCAIGAVAIALVFISGCGNDNNAEIASSSDHLPPFDVSEMTLSPAAIDLDTLQFESNNQALVTLRARVRLSPPPASLPSSSTSSIPPYRIRFFLNAVDSDAPTPSIELTPTPQGLPPNNGAELIYTFTTRFSRAQVGAYTFIAFTESVMSGRVGQTARQKVTILDSRASAPQLVGVNSPDTVRIPASGTLLIQITATATHRNGVGFIREVLATRTDNRSITFQLLDDGDRNGLSGDLIAGDGIFTATLQVPSTNLPAVRTFEYQAIDRNNTRSNVISRRIVFIR
jgi:hypothetical protein